MKSEHKAGSKEEREDPVPGLEIPGNSQFRVFNHYLE